MLSRIRGFSNRHRRKLVVGGVAIGGIIFLTRYAQRKIREWQEREVRDTMERMRRRQYFESTEKTCNQMIQSLALSSRETIAKVLDTEAIVEKLRSGCSDKLACWNELKILAIARSAVVIYSHVVLVTLVKIQFNLMGGHVYKDSQSSASSINESEIIQTRYMSMCSYFVHDGIQELCRVVREKVKEITASISLKNELSLRDLTQIYWAVVSSVSADANGDPCSNLARYALPPDRDVEEGAVLRKLIDETLDLLESEEVQNLAKSNVTTGFVVLVDRVAEYFTSSTESNSRATLRNGVSVPGTSNRVDTPWPDSGGPWPNHPRQTGLDDVNKVTMPMAKIIPIINGQVPHKPMPKDVPSEWLRFLMSNEDLRMLGANVYEAFSF